MNVRHDRLWAIENMDLLAKVMVRVMESVCCEDRKVSCAAVSLVMYEPFLGVMSPRDLS